MKLKNIILPMVAAALLAACSDDDNGNTWEKYADWRELNVNWVDEMAAMSRPDGKALYTKVVPEWNTNAYVLMRWYNDTTLTSKNLRPLYTSTVDVKYYGQLYNKEPFDSSYLRVSPADSIFRTRASDVIKGWTIALERMHVGDSVEVIVPWQQGYGSASQGALILPYSALKFQIKLVDIPGEYIRPVED